MIKSKKDIVIIMNNLRVGGAEKALLSLLQTFDYSNYNVDLLLFKQEGLFLKQVPKEVVLLDPPKEYEFFDMPFLASLFGAIKLFRFDILINRIAFTILFKREKRASIREQKSWRYIGATLQPLPKKYDLAIGFLENTPNYFCVDKVTATVKVGFVHNDYEKLNLSTKIDFPFFTKLDYVATVSEECLMVLQRNFPMRKDKFVVIENISSPTLIQKLASETIAPLHGGLKLLTIGRLSPQKGYDLLVETALLLKEKEVDFKWYILGVGALQEELNRMISSYKLEQQILFLGLKENPYPYVFNSDIYVQPSRFEGKSVAIDEAKILQKPIVVTNFPSAKDQITDGINGLIVEMHPKSLADGIISLTKDVDLKNRLIFNLSKETLNNEKEIEKFYEMISSSNTNNTIN